jgi:ABC-type sugar transport system ATPase subunit
MGTATALDTRTPVLSARSLSKAFGGVKAVQDVSFDVHQGECVALLGGNGAGKSTVVSMITGLTTADSGVVDIDGEVKHFRNPQDAREAGVETVFQNLALCDNLDAPANLFLGRELAFGCGPLRFVRNRAMRAETASMLARLGVSMPDLRVPIALHSGGQRQALAFLRATRRAPKLLVLDEPTAALGVREKRQLVAAVRGLIEEHSVSVVLVSHDMEEVRQLADRVVVLHQGRLAAESMPEVADTPAIVSLITGA